jgi:hypothetical protein
VQIFTPSIPQVSGELLMQFKSIYSSMFAILASIGLAQVAPASAQLVPEPWVTVGTKDNSVSYGAGVKFFDLGVEVGTGAKGVTGVDALKFFSFPFVSPYAGLGLYGDKGVAYSGGVHFSPPGNTFFGVGYHSIRGVNGQVGFKF